MKKWALLPWLMLYILLPAIPPVKSSACPVTCESGYIVKNCKCEKCKDEQFLSWRNGEARCNTCTASCADNDLIEVTPCTKTGDRSCQCKPGFFCPTPVKQTCRRRCEPCSKGFFTSTANLNRSCEEYTDCASLGMVVIREGSATSDRVCRNLASNPTPKPTTTMLDSTTQKPPTISPLHNQTVFTNTRASTKNTPARTGTSRGPVTSSPSETTAAPSTNADETPAAPSTNADETTAAPSTNADETPAAPSTNADETPAAPSTNADETTAAPSTNADETTAAPSTNAEVAQTPGEINHAPFTEGPVSPYEPLSKTTWILLLLLIISLLCLVSCLSLKCKSRSIKNKLRWAGLVYDRYPTVCPSASPNLSVQTSVPVNDTTDPVREHVQGQGSFLGKNQKVTMEHVGKADGINNTVGSIFIYSPGMVILGSNSNEKKEEAETSEEDSSEDTRLISVPQQESSSEEDFVRFATQEELNKELSTPIPATSK